MCVCVCVCVRACVRACVCGGGCRERFGGPYIKTFENPSSILASVICHIILSLSMFF